MNHPWIYHDGFWWFLYIFNHFYSCFEHPRYHWLTNSCWHMEFLEVNTGEPANPLQLSSSFRWMWHELWVSVTSPSFLRVSILDVAMLFIHFSLDADQNSKLVKPAKLVNMQIFFSRYVFQMSVFSKVFTCFFLITAGFCVTFCWLITVVGVCQSLNIGRTGRSFSTEALEWTNMCTIYV